MLIDEFIVWLEAERRYSPLTVRNYRRDVDDFVAFCGLAHNDFNPKNITREDVEEWVVLLTNHATTVDDDASSRPHQDLSLTFLETI